MQPKVIRCQPYHYAFSVLSFILCIPQQTQASVIKLLVSLSLSLSLSLLILNMITFVYILNICQICLLYIHACSAFDCLCLSVCLSVCLSLSLSLFNIYSKGKGYKLSNTEK